MIQREIEYGNGTEEGRPGYQLHNFLMVCHCLHIFFAKISSGGQRSQMNFGKILFSVGE